MKRITVLNEKDMSITRFRGELAAELLDLVVMRSLDFTAVPNQAAGHIKMQCDRDTSFSLQSGDIEFTIYAGWSVKYNVTN
jgi:hypothetical protein